MNRYLIPVIVFVALAAILGIGLTLDPRHIPSPLVDKPAPAFSVPDLIDPAITVSNLDFKGQVTVFNVFASWCVACRDEHPLLTEFAKSGIAPLMGLNYKDPREDALAWLDHFGNPYWPIAFDLGGKVGIDWGVYGVPETFVVDSQGVIRYKHIGPVTPDTIKNEIVPLVRELQAEAS